MNGMMRALLALVLVAAALAAPGMTAPQARADEELYGASMYFPVVGENYYTDTFGAPRSGGRTHQGVDIMADKMTPVIAVASGTVGWMHNEQGGDCCAMELKHDDGWVSWYIHLNNDTPGTDDEPVQRWQQKEVEEEEAEHRHDEPHHPPLPGARTQDDEEVGESEVRLVEGAPEGPEHDGRRRRHQQPEPEPGQEPGGARRGHVSSRSPGSVMIRVGRTASGSSFRLRFAT